MENNNTHIPAGYKTSELGVIPQEWEVKRLGELGDFSKGNGVPKDKIIDKGLPCLTYGDIYTKFNYVIKNIFQYIDAQTALESKQVIKGDILFAGSGETLKDIGKNVAFVDDAPIYAGGDIIIFSPKIEIDSVTLSYILCSENSNRQKYRMGQGHSVVHIYSKNLERLIVAVPPLEEQRRIAEVLGCWDEAIERQGRMVSLLTTRKRALMHRLLTPKPHWQKTKLSEIAERVTRKNTENNTNVMTISAQRGFVSQTDFFNKSIASEITDNYFLVHKDEFCYNKSYCNGYPMGAIKRLNNADKAVVTTLYICFRIKCSKCSIDFLEHFFEAGLLNKHLMKIANEGGRAHGLLNVTPTDFFAIQINIPPFAEQREIAEKLSTADVEIDLARRHLDLLRTQKQALMQQLLTGKKQLQ